MKITSISIKNFKQFYGEQRLEVSTRADKNITVFHGGNGTGKTSLFTAINWCLYGLGHEGTGELLNKQILKESSEGQNVEVAVRVGFREKSHEYIADRCWQFSKKNGEAVASNRTFNLNEVDRRGQTTKVGNPEGVMDSILPGNVREYFFFNGEKMDDLTRPGSTKIEDAIKNIMHLPIIDKAVAHLESVTKEYRKEISGIATDKLEKLIADQEHKEDEITCLKQDIENLNNEIQSAENHVKEIEKILLDSKEVGQLQLRRNLLQGEIVRLEHSRDELEAEIQKVVNSCYPIFIEDKAKISLQIINAQVEKGRIPSGIREQFIEELISKKECICGRPLQENTPSLQTLLLLLSSKKSTELEDTVLNLKGGIRNLSSLTSVRMSTMKIHSKNYQSIVDQIEQKDREYDDLQRRIGNSEEVDIARLDNRLQTFKNDIINYRVDISNKRNRIENNQIEIKNILRQREEEEKNQLSLVKLSTRESLARKSAEAMSTIKSKFYEETRIRIESETKDVFKKFSWKSDQFNDINLDKDFHFEVIDRWAKPSREELSAGERQMLSLSFISALSRLSGEEAPMIMDTPFARLSGNHLENLTNNLPELIPQLILFVTDTEWTSDVQNGLEDRIGLEYNLAFQDGFTRIVEENHGR